MRHAQRAGWGLAVLTLKFGPFPASVVWSSYMEVMKDAGEDNNGQRKLNNVGGYPILFRDLHHRRHFMRKSP